MPELPEVEAVRRALQPVMEGARFERVVTNRPDLRVPFPSRFAARLEGQTVRLLERRGKYLVATLSSGGILLMHLGMSGSFRVETDTAAGTPGAFRFERSEAVAHDHVVFRMSSGATITFNDPRRFGFMDLVARDRLARHPAVGGLGPEPLDAAFDAAALARACRAKKTTLKAALLDQRVVAGLGNIYVSEALHRARLSPRRRASTIATREGAPRDTARALTAAIKKVLTEAVVRGIAWREANAGGTSDAAYFPLRFRVYDRAGLACRRAGCQGIVKRIVQGGRATFFCPVCQK